MNEKEREQHDRDERLVREHDREMTHPSPEYLDMVAELERPKKK